MTYYIDVPETSNTDLLLDDKKVVTVVPSVALKTFTDQIITFSVAAGDVYTMTASNFSADLFAAGDRIIVRGSVDTSGLINNDGLYTVLTNPAGSITVKEIVKAVASVGTVCVEEYDTFILHPTKRTGQICVLIVLGATPSEMDVSFVPGGYWASKPLVKTAGKSNLPAYQGETLLANKTYFVQVETAPYLQTEEEDLYTDAVTTIDKKGTMLMRLFPKKSEALTVEVDVALVQLA